jgi:hypothetical protein
LANTGERRRSATEFAWSSPRTGEYFAKKYFQLRLIRVRVRVMVGPGLGLGLTLLPILRLTVTLNLTVTVTPTLTLTLTLALMIPSWRYFWRTVRQFAANSAPIHANSGELRLRSPSVYHSSREKMVGKLSIVSERGRGSRRTIVRRLYCLESNTVAQFGTITIITDWRHSTVKNTKSIERQ